MGAAVERVLERLGVRARKFGRRWWAERCPLPTHGEHNPRHEWRNFYVFADHSTYPGRFRCYSCGASGRLPELVARVMRIEFRAALEWLRDVEDAAAPEPVSRVRYEVVGGLRKCFSLPPGVEFEPLARWNSVARRYAEGRGLDGEQVSRWGIGYALEGFLAGRVVFPIVDSSGRLANYAARTFVDDETRYLAARPWERPDLSAMLGERFWPPREHRADSAVVVFEGALSGMALDRALRRAGIRAELAGLQGSDASDPRRASRLASFGRVVLASDPDAAGEKVARQVAAALRSSRSHVSRLEYPRPGADAADTPPDELAGALERCLRGGISGA